MKIAGIFFFLKTMKMRFLILILFLGPFVVSFAQNERHGMLRDSTDGALDISHFLFDLHGFLPIVMPITEPAVGYGAALAATFFFPKPEDGSGKFKMPDVAAAAGAYTQNGTWFVGGGYFGFWNQDRIRFRGVGGYAAVNLNYYTNLKQNNEEVSASYSMDALFLLTQSIFRLGKSNFWLGGKYQLSKIEVSSDFDGFFGLVNPEDRLLTLSSIGGVLEYEDLNNQLSPTAGFRSNFTYDQNLEVLGSDRDFSRISWFAHTYVPLNDWWTAGFRLETQAAFGTPPFFALPFLSMRGVPVLRYQGEWIGLAETEQQWFITKRWSLVGFGGYGFTYNQKFDQEITNQAWNAGGGFRYLVARKLGLRGGIDAARGPESWAFYITVGTAWLR
jgi:hypothetical protein